MVEGGDACLNFEYHIIQFESTIDCHVFVKYNSRCIQRMDKYIECILLYTYNRFYLLIQMKSSVYTKFLKKI